MSVIIGIDGQPLASDYEAARTGRRSANWRASASGPNAAAIGNASTLRNRAHERARNDGYEAAALRIGACNEIGTGIKCLPLGGSDRWQRNARALFDAWIGEADATGMLDWYGLQAQVSRGRAEGGEVFVRLRYRRDRDMETVPLQVQTLEAEHVPTDMTRTLGTNRIVAGIEFSPIGARAAYWMYPDHPGDGLFTAASMTPVRVPAESVIHVYEPLRPGQIRGLPDAVTALATLKLRDDTDDAVHERLRIASLITTVITSPEGDVLGDGSTDSDGEPLQTLEPGSVLEMRPGEEVAFPSLPEIGSNYAEFARNTLLRICAARGIPYELLVGDMRGVSDRALRVVINEYRRRVEQRQWLCLIPQFCSRVWRAWLDQAVLSGRLTTPGYDDPARRADYRRVRWIPQGWPYIHPLQDVQAAEASIAARLTSRDDVIYGRGDDPEAVDAAIAASEARAKSAGIELPAINTNRSPTGSDAPDGQP